jgi:hypothetical protein
MPPSSSLRERLQGRLGLRSINAAAIVIAGAVVPLHLLGRVAGQRPLDYIVHVGPTYQVVNVRNAARER